MWQAIARALSNALGEPFEASSRRAMGGGCINEAFCLQGERRAFMVKLNSAGRLPMFEAEAAGLAAIRASGALRAPEPIAWGVEEGKSWLAIEFIPFGPPGPQSARLLGTQLAQLHRTTASRFGWDRDNTIGTTPQPNPWSDDWLVFLRKQRIGYQLELARGNGLSATIVNSGAQLLEQLPALFADYSPPPSLLHGDLWGGNWATDQAGNPVLFDPAVYFGDRESDLAMTELFGGFDPGFYQAYRQAWPLDSGYPRRKPLYQLYHLLNHFNLFGQSYGSQCAAVIDQLLGRGRR